MRKIDVTKLNNVNTLLDAKYGKEGTASREEFNKEAIAYYYGEILKEKRKELNLTQEQLSEKAVYTVKCSIPHPQNGRAVGN